MEIDCVMVAANVLDTPRDRRRSISGNWIRIISSNSMMPSTLSIAFVHLLVRSSAAGVGRCELLARRRIPLSRRLQARCRLSAVTSRVEQGVYLLTLRVDFRDEVLPLACFILLVRRLL